VHKTKKAGKKDIYNYINVKVYITYIFVLSNSIIGLSLELLWMQCELMCAYIFISSVSTNFFS